MSNYPNNIMSIYEKYNANVPAVLGAIDLNQRIQQGTQPNPEDLKHAQSTATALRSLLELGTFPELTEEVVRGAELRAVAIKNIQATLEYTPGNMIQLLQEITTSIQGIQTDIQSVRADIQSVRADIQSVRADIQSVRDEGQIRGAEIQGIRDEVRIGRAETNNALGRIKNRFISRETLVTVQKTVPGSGLELARAVADLPNFDQARQALEVYGAANPQPAIGTTPTFFHGNIDSLTHTDILKLICFYNDDMGITPNAGLVVRKQAIRNYLTTF